MFHKFATGVMVFGYFQIKLFSIVCIILQHACTWTSVCVLYMCFLHLHSPCVCLCSCKVECINLSLSNPLFVMRSHNIGTHVEPRCTQKSDRLIAHSDALLCFTAACANSHNSEIERLRLREEDTFDLSVCQYVYKNQGSIFDLFFFLNTAHKWLDHMLSLSQRLLVWFAPAGDGMELTWSFSIWTPVDHSELCSSPELRRHGTDLLFRGYSLPVD